MVLVSSSVPGENHTSPWPSGQCFKIRKLISLTYSLGAFLLPLHWSLWHLSLCMSLSRAVSPLLPLGLMDTSLGFQTRCFWRSSLRGRSLELGCVMWSTNPLLLRENLWICEIPLECELWLQGWGFWWDPILVSYPPVCSPSLVCCEATV